MIDLTGEKLIMSDYGGSELKFAILYKNQKYMIKLPDSARSTKLNVSYINNQFSEDIGCKIFKSVGIPVQETFLAKYKSRNGVYKIVVACKDFRGYGEQLYEADKIAKSFVNSLNMAKSRYEDIQKVFDIIQNKLPNNENVTERFWDTFVVDALIGNKDRHMGNWGVLSSDRENLKLAPVYDCGSSLNSLCSDEELLLLINNKNAFKNSEFNIPSNISINEKRVFYHEIFKNPPQELKEAILRIAPRIDKTKIQKIIDGNPALSNIRKRYIKESIELRYNEIILPAIKKIQKNILKDNYADIETMTNKIKSDLLAGRRFNDVQKEALKYIQGDNIIIKKAKFRTAIKNACRNPMVRKIVEKEKNLER